MAYDMNEPQSVKGAALHLFRSVLLNWLDEYCVRFPRNLVPALEKGGAGCGQRGGLAGPGGGGWDERLVG